MLPTMFAETLIVVRLPGTQRTSLQDDAVTLWCLETRACVMRGEGHGSWVTGVAFDFWTSRPNYYRFTSVGEDARLCM